MDRTIYVCNEMMVLFELHQHAYLGFYSVTPLKQLEGRHGPVIIITRQPECTLSLKCCLRGGNPPPANTGLTLSWIFHVKRIIIIMYYNSYISSIFGNLFFSLKQIYYTYVHWVDTSYTFDKVFFFSSTN